MIDTMKITHKIKEQLCSHKELEIDKSMQEKVDYLSKERPGFPIFSIMRCKKCGKSISHGTFGVKGGENVRNHIELNMPLYVFAVVVIILPLILFSSPDARLMCWLTGAVIIGWCALLSN